MSFPFLKEKTAHTNISDNVVKLFHDNLHVDVFVHGTPSTTTNDDIKIP